MGEIVYCTFVQGSYRILRGTVNVIVWSTRIDSIMYFVLCSLEVHASTWHRE